MVHLKLHRVRLAVDCVCTKFSNGAGTDRRGTHKIRYPGTRVPDPCVFGSSRQRCSVPAMHSTAFCLFVNTLGKPHSCSCTYTVGTKFSTAL
eukprot:SAG11_NODE_6263_length_1348_cov_5.891113_1_plen_92_part_00